MLHDYSPELRKERYRYIKDIAVQYETCMLKVMHKGSIRNDTWIFRVDPESHDHQKEIVNTAVDCIRKSAKYVESWVVKAFQNLPYPGCSTQADFSNLREYFLAFVGDIREPNTAVGKQKRALIELSIQSGDKSLLEDARKMNRRPESKEFEEFWKQTQEYLNEKVDAAHARRHGIPEEGYFSDVLSCRELHETVTRKMQQDMGERFDDTLVPSLSTLYLQFMPSSSRLLTESRFKGRFAVQMKVQKRILHIDHIDAHYGNAIIKYLRSFAVKFRNICSFYSADDKARINIGPPGVFLQSGVRNRAQLTPVGTELLALDHDYDGTCLVPSVYLRHEIPYAVGGDWYKGKVSVGIKDGVFQRSCPWRHAEELKRQYQNVETPILMLLTDGGPDRMLKRATVLAAHISLFLSLDLDMLIVSRTVPYLSFRNPVERVMSTLNYGLQNVSLCRQRPQSIDGSPDDTLEKQLKGCNSMSAIREKAKTFPISLGGEKEFISLFHSSLENAKRKISDRMSRLGWKNESIGMYEAVDESGILELVETFLQTDDNYSDNLKAKCRSLGSIDITELQRKNSPIKEFISNHVKQSPYMLQMKKKDGCTCSLCRLNMIKPPRMEAEAFRDLKWMPLPLKKEVGEDGKMHYKDFEDLYGLEPNHTEQPSLKSSNPSSKGEHGLYTANRARFFVKCSHCVKPRVIYVSDVKQRLTKNDKAFLTHIDEGGHYVCGSELTTCVSCVHEENEMNLVGEDDVGEGSTDNQFFPRNGLTCATPVEITYFFSQSLSTKRNLGICPCCGLDENHIQQPTEEELEIYSGKVFYPCNACIKTKTPTPEPYRGSQRKKRKRTSIDVARPPARQFIREGTGEGSVIEGDCSDTEPSGDFSLCDD